MSSESEHAESSPSKTNLVRIATVECELRRDEGAVVETAAGIRIKVGYTGNESTVSCRGTDGKNRDLTQTYAGKVASGSDWVLVSKDGIVSIESRVTLKLMDQGETWDSPFLVDATLRAMIDLDQAFQRVNGYEEYLRGRESCPAFSVFGSVRFESATAVPIAADLATMPRHIRDSAQNAARFVHLTRQQFVASGEIAVLDRTPQYPPRNVKLNVWGQTSTW